MALLFMDGFDAGDVNIKGYYGAWTSVGTSSPATRFAVGRWAGLYNSASARRQLASAANQVFVGAAIAVEYNNGASRPYITLYGDGAGTAHITVAHVGGGVVVYRGTTGGTAIASYSFPTATYTFYYIEVTATIADSGGVCKVRVNGTEVINFTGDTRNGGTNTTIDNIVFGNNTGTWTWWDDLYICDDTGSAPHNNFLGDVRIHTLTPNGAGSLTQLTPSSGANYTTVDELPYSASDFVAGTAGQGDLYTASDLPAGAGVIYGVQTNAISKKTDAGTMAGRAAIKSGSTTYYSTSTTVGTVDQTISRIDQTNPATSAAWTSSEVNGIEIGVGAV